jgi:RNA polymerase-binding transcription factor DksA
VNPAGIVATMEPDTPAPLDLDAVLADLDAVEHALERLDAGTYFTDEVSGATLPDELLAADPTARRGG